MGGASPTFDQAGGTLTVNGSFPVTGATFIYHGGTIAGPFVLSGATLDLEASVASPDTFILEGSNTLASDVPAGHILQIIDGAGPSTLTSGAGFSNHGSIVFDTTIGYGNTLAVTSGGSPTPPTAASPSTPGPASPRPSAASSSTTAMSRSRPARRCRSAARSSTMVPSRSQAGRPCR